MTRAKYTAKVKRELESQGYQPVKAVYDAGGNCTICGEAGRCPGWHKPSDIPPQRKGE